jgi:hypothetical protein
MRRTRTAMLWTNTGNTNLLVHRDTELPHLSLFTLPAKANGAKLSENCANDMKASTVQFMADCCTIHNPGIGHPTKTCVTTPHGFALAFDSASVHQPTSLYSPSCKMLTPIDFLKWEMLGTNPGAQCIRRILLISLHVCSSTYHLIKLNAKDTSMCRLRIFIDSIPQI